jgi:hypothetical protein
VRSGANGDGSDWDAAYPALPDTLERGAVYFVADGEYGSYAFDDAPDEMQLITVLKATAESHGADAGWSDEHGDGQAVFTNWNITTDDWLVDGQSGGGPGCWTSGFGFRVESLDTGAGSGPNVEIAGSHVTARRFEAQGNGGDGDGVGASNDIVAVNGGDDVTVSLAYLYDAGRCLFFLSGTNLVFEYIYGGEHESTANQHSEIASIWNFSVPVSDVTFRHSIFTHAEGTGGLIMEGDGLYVYGNVFYQAPGSNWEAGNGVIGTWTVSTLTNVKVYNNTFVSVTPSPGGALGTLFTAPITGNEAMNNLFYATPSIAYELIPVHSHNHYIDSGAPSAEEEMSQGNGDPFTNVSALDFSLTANTPPGTALPAPYDVDPTGTPRSTWTRGAYEFSAGN